MGAPGGRKRRSAQLRAAALVHCSAETGSAGKVAMTASQLLDLVRPFLWLAVAAFFTGFVSYVVLGGSHATASAKVEPAAYAPSASAPSSDAWNLPKRV